MPYPVRADPGPRASDPAERFPQRLEAASDGSTSPAPRSRAASGGWARLALVALGVVLAGPALATTADAAKPRRAAAVIYGVCGGHDLCTVDPKRKKVVRVAKGTAAEPYTAVTATANGATIAFARGGRIYRAGARASRPQQVGGGQSPLISPDGRTVVWKTEIQTQQCDWTGACRQLQTPAMFRRGASEAEPTVVEVAYLSGGWWGDRLLSAATRKGTDADDVFLLTAEGRQERAVTQDPARSFDAPASSPDRKLLAVTSEPAPVGGAELRFRGRIELFDPVSAQRVRTLTEGTDDATGGFSPDGRSVAFARGGDLYVVPTAGGAAKRIAKRFVVTGPSWASR